MAVQSDLLDMCIQDGIALRRSGRAYTAKCPFHHDTKPSFQVRLTGTGYWVFKCWSTTCGVKGGARRYRELTNRPPPEQPERPGNRPRRQYDKPTPELLDLVARHYAEQLAQSPPALKYLAERGIAPELAAAWGLGYAPGDTAYRLLQSRMNEKEIAKCPFLRHHRKDDRFARRIVIPQLLPGGRRGWSTSRAIDPDREPKYLHLPGPRPALMRIARVPGKNSRYEIITEGPFDALAVMAAGFPAQTTNGNPYEHLLAEEIRKQQLETVFILPDRDQGGAGWAAAVGRAAQKAGAKPVPLELPEWANDPGDLLNAGDERKAAGAVAAALRIGQVRHPRGWTAPETAKAEQHTHEEQAAMPFPDGENINFFGNLTKDPETRQTRNGNDMTVFGVAANHSAWDSNEEKYVTNTIFYQCRAFGNLGNMISKKLRKGDYAWFSGNMTFREYERRDGSTGYSHDVNVEKGHLYLALTKREDDPGGRSRDDRDDQDDRERGRDSDRKRDRDRRPEYARPQPAERGRARDDRNDRDDRDDRVPARDRSERGRNRDERDPRGNWTPPPEDDDDLPF